MRAPLTAVSAFQRRAPAHFLRRPRTGKIATSVITRVYAEKAAQRNGSVRLCEAQLWGSHVRLPLMARNGHGPMSDLSPLSGVKRKSNFGAVRSVDDPDVGLASRDYGLSPSKNS